MILVSTPHTIITHSQREAYRYMSLKQNDSKDRTHFVLINKALFFCLTVHKTIDNEHRMYVDRSRMSSMPEFDSAFAIKATVIICLSSVLLKYTYNCIFMMSFKKLNILFE